MNKWITQFAGSIALAFFHFLCFHPHSISRHATWVHTTAYFGYYHINSTGSLQRPPETSIFLTSATVHSRTTPPQLPNFHNFTTSHKNLHLKLGPLSTGGNLSLTAFSIGHMHISDWLQKSRSLQCSNPQLQPTPLSPLFSLRTCCKWRSKTELAIVQQVHTFLLSRD
jgi:hypothetical protein